MNGLIVDALNVAMRHSICMMMLKLRDLAEYATCKCLRAHGYKLDLDLQSLGARFLALSSSAVQ